MNNQDDKVSQKENKKSPENRDIEICDPNDREFKTAFLKKTQRYNKILIDSSINFKKITKKKTGRLYQGEWNSKAKTNYNFWN